MSPFFFFFFGGGGVIFGGEDMTIIHFQKKMQNSSQLCTYQRDCIQ
jgi:hypothetical protein